MKKSIILLYIAYILLSSTLAYCNETNEVNVRQTFKKICWLFKENTDETLLKEYAVDSFDYEIEILKNSPGSLEAYYSLFQVKANAFKSYRYKIEKYFAPLNEKHFSHIDDPDFEEAEKLIYLIMYSQGIGVKSVAEDNEQEKKAYEVLNFMKDNCKNKNYAALANALLLLTSNYEMRMKYIGEFLEKFSTHPAIPSVKLNKIIYLYELNKASTTNANAQKCIEETNVLLNEYNKLNLPQGWPFSMDCYSVIINCYQILNDYDNAKKYYDLIEKEAPGYWNLSNLKEMLDKMKANKNIH